MTRIATALVMIPLFAWIIVFAPFEVFRVTLVIVGALAYLEFHQLARRGSRMLGGVAPEALPGVVAGVALLYAPDPGLAAILIAVAAMTLALGAADLKDALPWAAALTLAFCIFLERGARPKKFAGSRRIG